MFNTESHLSLLLFSLSLLLQAQGYFLPSSLSLIFLSLSLSLSLKTVQSLYNAESLYIFGQNAQKSEKVAEPATRQRDRPEPAGPSSPNRRKGRSRTRLSLPLQVCRLIVMRR